ncbi:hypothetical protein [Haloarcula litorea]|uniref:GHMP family kinase ATP-binding protein n=1 Tax=Haloarcula litorea TaxID=3032579 RepID=UPI0023E87E1D|nr:hypothetical protein [Halomicroarcula sp. GDY20]
MRIESRAPNRMSFGGGGSDVPPYCWEHGGEVVSTTVDKYARATLVPGGDRITIRSVDFGVERSFPLGRLEYTGGDLDLIKAVVNQFDVGEGFELTVQTDLPAGAGMGGSSSVAAAVIGCLREFADREMDAADVASLAYYAEREDLGEIGGYQDQYAAAYGGLNDIEFADEETTVRPLDVPDPLVSTLERRLLLYFTGETHDSSEIHDEMDRQYRRETRDAKTRRDRLKAVAAGMADALDDGDLDRFGDLLHEGWVVKKELSDKITNPVVDEMYATAREHGAAGGKILGAGGGGHLLLFAAPGRAMDVRYALREYDVEPVPFQFEPDGVRTWEVDDAD